MTEEKKMDRVMEQHAAAKARRTGNDPMPIKNLVNAWELDDRDAPLVCPQCKMKRIGKVPKSWWALAKSRNEESPFWKVPCDPCHAAAEETSAKFAEPPAPEASEELELDLPTKEKDR